MYNNIIKKIHINKKPRKLIQGLRKESSNDYSVTTSKVDFTGTNPCTTFNATKI